MNGPFKHFNDGDFRNFVASEAEDGDPEIVHRLFALRTKDYRNSWFTIRNQRNELAGYLADLEIARELAEKPSRTNPESVAHSCRYALFAAAIRDLSRNQPPELSARYVKAGVWTREQALTWARLNPNRQSAVRAVREVLQQDEGRSGDEIARMALSAGASIADADNKVLAVAALAQDLPPHLLGQALELVEAEKNEGSRMGGIQALLPHLPNNLRREALAVARRFKAESLKAEAIAIVAASLDEPEREDVFRLSLQIARKAISRDGEDTGLTRRLPRYWLTVFYEMFDEETYPNTREAILFRYLELLVDEDPDAVWSKVNRMRSWQRQTLAMRVAVAFAKAGRYEDASAAAQLMESDLGGERTSTIFKILKHIPESEWPSWIELLGEPERTYFIPRLRELASSADVSAALLRKLANIAVDERLRLEARAIISPVLRPEEVNDLLDDCLRPDSPSDWDPFIDLGPYLSVDQVRRALDCLGEPGIFETKPYQILIRRLVQFGEIDDAFARVNALSDMLESSRAEILAFLAENIPPKDLPRVMMAIRPASVTSERILARASLLPWLTEESVESVLLDVCSLEDSLDQLRIFAEMTTNFPTTKLDRVGEVLLKALEESFPLQSRDQSELLQKGFRALSEVLKRSPRASLVDKALELACHEMWSDAGKLVLLMNLAISGNGGRHITSILEKAFEIAGQNPTRLAIISERLANTHSAALLELLRRQIDPEKLVALLDAGAAFLNPAASAEAHELLCAIKNPQLRLRALNALIRYLPKGQRKLAATSELARKSEWIHDWDCVVLAAHIFADDAADLVRQNVENLEISFDLVDAWMKVLSAGSVSIISRSREPIAKAFRAIEGLEDWKKCQAVQVLAPLLGSEEIRLAIGLLPPTQTEDLVPALAALVRRAVILEDSDLIHVCLEADDGTLARSELIQEVARVLPIDVVRQLARHEKHDQNRLAALAARAAELGDLRLTFSLLDEKGGSTSSDDQTYRLVYRVAPLSDLEELVKYVDKRYPSQRAEALLELVKRVPRRMQTRLAKSILDSVQLENMSRHVLEVFHELEPQLKRLSTSEILSRWTKSMRIRGEQGREQVLVEIRAFAPTLVSHFGAEVAVKLDEAICLGAQNLW